MTEIYNEVLRRVKPDKYEREHLVDTVRELDTKITEFCRRENIPFVNLMQCGSSARDTWLKGNHDIDMFISFLPTVSREDLERYGLAIGEAFPKRVVSYAEHPYTIVEFNGYEVDLVPCYDIKQGEPIISAVDRTPFHQQFLYKKMAQINEVRKNYSKQMGIDFTSINDDVRLFKQFCKGAGVYGSEHKTQGFSGYACELLVTTFGSFKGAIEFGATASFGLRVDPTEGKPGGVLNATSQTEPLVIHDPVDFQRNVAAALSEQKFWEFVHACRMYLKNPTADAFFPMEPGEPTLEKLGYLLEGRDTSLFCVPLDVPEGLVEDNYFPRLRKLENQFVDTLEQNEFRVFKSDVWSDMRYALIILELEFAYLPKVKRQLGPKVIMIKAFEPYIAAHPDAYIHGDRYAANVERKYPWAETVIEDIIRKEPMEGLRFSKDSPKYGPTQYPKYFYDDDVFDKMPEARKHLYKFLGGK